MAITTIELIDAAATALMLTILITAGYSDWRARRIPNSLSLLLVATFVIRSSLLTLFYDIPVMVLWGWPVITALIVFIVGAIMFARGLIGGGDVKLLSSMAFFAGPAFIMPTLFVMSVAGGLIAAFMLMRNRLSDNAIKDAPAVKPAGTQAPAEPRFDSTDDGGETSHSKAVKVPYGLAIMASGFWLAWALHGPTLSALLGADLAPAVAR